MNWYKVLNNLTQLALLAGAAYVSVNPKYAWLVPFFQGAGAVLPQPTVSVE
jgi:hypothetical protein